MGSYITQTAYAQPKFTITKKTGAYTLGLSTPGPLGQNMEEEEDQLMKVFVGNGYFCSYIRSAS